MKHPSDFAREERLSQILSIILVLIVFGCWVWSNLS